MVTWQRCSTLARCRDVQRRRNDDVMCRVSAPRITQSSYVSSSSSNNSINGPGQLRCRASYAVIREWPSSAGEGAATRKARVLTACPGDARRTVYQLHGNNAEISIVGSKTMISSSALLLRFDGQYSHLRAQAGKTSARSRLASLCRFICPVIGLDAIA